jgi:hypothetical protein
MLLPAPPLRPRKKSDKSAARLGSPLLLSLTIAGVIDVGLDGEGGTVTVLFNTTEAQPLLNTSPSPAKWSARYQNVRYSCGLVTWLNFDRIILAMTATGPETGSDEVVYTNAPSDVMDVIGRHLTATTFAF